MSDENLPNNSDPRLDSRNYGQVSKRDLEALEGLKYAKRIHWDHFTVPKMPWHTDDHKFGESTDDKDKRVDVHKAGGGPPDNGSREPGEGDGQGGDKEGE